MRAFPNSRRTSPRSTLPMPTAEPAVSTPSTTRPAERRGGLRRAAALAAAAAVACSAGIAFAPSSSAAIAEPATPENAAARVAILQSVAAHPDPTLIPEDFVTFAGYRPVVEGGMLINPKGDCSSPVPLPAEFDLACDAHDLGYDLLRYAASTGQPLGPWARQTADAGLERRMHAACETRANPLSRSECHVMAGIAATAVDLNSVRQDYGNPIYEPFFEHDGTLPSPATLSLAGIGLAVGLATATTVLVRRNRSRRAASGTSRPGGSYEGPFDPAVAL
ncbi:hypothetical protein ACFXHA_37460 [Nocardia sp. NPDC059240]|uniref:hypothetical protein n=1 Tax=Nocardia sp. NPDC059240 TaxID=3346786 RepID=UPI0036782533